MTNRTNTGSKPRIIISDSDYERLSALADGVHGQIPDVAEELLSEMDRADVVTVGAVPRNVVQMGSTVEFQSGLDQHRRVTLVFPGEEDIADNKISILTPIGTALIGLSAGQSIGWTARDGRRHDLTVVSVEPPESA